MISILIPAKDYDCHELIGRLYSQCERCGTDFEILVGEDGTAPENLIYNSNADRLGNCHRIISESNVGRAKIRNRLAAESKYPLIVFIDCDAVVEKDDFIECYIDSLKEHEVVCGGLYHANVLHDRRCSLRFAYEKNADRSRDAATRNRRPYDKFTTFNFGIRRELFMSIKFNESISRYGHEDTLFGNELQRRGSKIIHIDNRLLHNGMEDNATFLLKTEQSLQTLAEIEDRITSTPLLKTVSKLKRMHLTRIFMLYWNIDRKRLRKNLLGEKPSLREFNIYKLGYYIANIERLKKKTL